MTIKMIRRIDPTESQIQCAIIDWAHTVKVSSYRLSDFLIKISNEGKRGFFTAKKMKKEGLKKGVSDLFLAFPIRGNAVICGLWLEIKSKKGRLSIPQMEWITLMQIVGYQGEIVFSVDEGIQAIKDYLGKYHESK